MSGAVYNENDPAAAAWLRELIANNLIAPGDVDERSIKDVRADDYRRYDQVHGFAGIGIYSAALRHSGWEDSRPICSASVPCQPFSAAGKGLGFDDPRHLLPEWVRLLDEALEQGLPWADVCVGEQVASAGFWLDSLRTQMEDRGYAFGVADIPAAGFAQGAHIRQRLYWVADRNDPERWADLAGRHFGDWPQAGRIEGYGESGAGGATGRVADHDDQRGDRSTALEQNGRRQSASAGCAERLGYHHHPRPQGWVVERLWGGDQCAVRSPGLVDGVDWLLCQDQRIRPVESGTFPLALEDSGRVGRLRGYGNSLDFETAVNFISAYMEAAEIKAVMSELT